MTSLILTSKKSKEHRWCFRQCKIPRKAQYLDGNSPFGRRRRMEICWRNRVHHQWEWFQRIIYCRLRLSQIFHSFSFKSDQNPQDSADRCSLLTTINIDEIEEAMVSSSHCQSSIVRPWWITSVVNWDTMELLKEVHWGTALTGEMAWLK